jgi:5-methylcytosine-specific restriction endonuclease McrA
MPRKMTREQYNEHMRVYMLERYHRRRAAAIERLGGHCVGCGTTVDLQFDHIDPETKVQRFAKIWSANEVKFWAEIAKMQLLCDPCHRDKTRQNGDLAKGRAREAKKRLGV